MVTHVKFYSFLPAFYIVDKLSHKWTGTQKWTGTTAVEVNIENGRIKPR